MPDNKNITHPDDSKRIDVHDLHEVRNWCQALGCTVEELVNAVAAVGTWAKDVRAYLQK